ncbi:restriction endonuclease subunit S [Aeromonas rivipollensis]|uniref:restriction endonuclease subunit S n=1 Tax=Aeromonas rivipollensis TaxID=948519 RepID=UPI00259F4C74|nr:restriction endonuclease subunit S [Aeromonas rivipollensis]MDM5092079.1 restriction endonuclease subunit S [Aeromonas rivipollensis]
MNHVTIPLCELFQIGSSKRVLKSEWKDAGVPFYRGREVTRLAIDGSVNNELFITEEHYAALSKGNGVPSAGDIIITAIGTIGNSYIVQPTDRFYFKDASILWMKRNSDVLSEYVNLWLKSPLFFEQLDRGNGATVDTLTIKKLQSVRIRLPPLAEQQRIVDILDEALEAIANTRANAEQNRQNVRALFESYLQSVFSQRGDGWTEKPLGEMATFRNGVNFTKSSQGEPINILGVKDFQDYYWAPLNSLDSIIPDGTLPDTDTLQQNDIVFVRSNGNPELIGRCLLIGEVQERITFSGFTIRARRFTEEVLPQYLCHFLKSSHIRRELVDGGNGANIRSLNQGALSRLRINFPVALSEQERIVEQLETMLSETQLLESLYQRKIAALDELKQSLLKQAFSGQL